jgi:hypothetical protein
MAYSACGCASDTSPGPMPAGPDDAGLPLCGCTPGANGSGNCAAAPTCTIPTCPVGGTQCCTPTGLCGCAPEIPAGPYQTCN